MGLFSGTRPSDLGVRNGKLKPPPSTPNCVSSQAQGGYYAIAPLPYRGTRGSAFAALLAIVRSTPRTRIVEQTADYLYVEYASALMGYVDDVEFWFAPEGGIIHVRSASRLGQGDMGVNRRRVEDIRARLAAAGA
ncbi:MAG: DUF1499 domain-containing protein [Betaproteobacteria bacterium]|jgi:uncharacterized protein (DUF1499 family)|nr:DUF1499 domain-containing protein [Rhodocyclaceae bacterium]MCA3141538.1 DUF1499 domain-containing protein [Rhodocyclaceae bacterium]MCE2897662.1 DUF1499 domain-containing protein [Betaproteobacteria bacterium]